MSAGWIPSRMLLKLTCYKFVKFKVLNLGPIELVEHLFPAPTCIILSLGVGKIQGLPKFAWDLKLHETRW